MRKTVRFCFNVIIPTFLFMLISGCNGSPKMSNNATSSEQESKFKLVEMPDEKKVEIWIGSELFTAYIYPDNIAKPVLYPILTSSGKVLSRSYPLETTPGERIDHPHQVGHWFNYGDVNGLDFWNNSEARPVEDRDRYGTIYHKEVVNTEGGDEFGLLEVTSEWKAPDGNILLDEHTKFIFSMKGSTRIIERVTTLKALEDISFKDSKEGLFGMRVARALELPIEKPAIFLDSHGNPAETIVVDNTGVNGNYLSSEGLEGGDVWGTRARWVNLYSTIEDEPVALVIIDHPDNVGYPTYWMARDYGLFAANPLGQAVFSNGEEVLDFKLKANEEVTFKYQLLVHSGSVMSAEKINAMADKFAEQ